LQVLRLVIDAIQECNLRCKYCHPGKVWVRQHLDVEHVRRVLVAAEEYGCLEVVLSGGEITMHPQLAAILDATHLLRRTVVSLITNATLLDDDLVGALRRSNVTRICVSVDGVDDETHNSARGRTRDRVMDGLRRVREAGKEITVISVAHQGNFRRLAELSLMLANEGLASQHHMCAPSYSGQARRYYSQLRLEREDYFALQDAIDRVHDELAARGVYVTFNSFWPATGQRSAVVDSGRKITLQQLSEQRLVHVRPDGELRLTLASWGRETVGSGALGNVRIDAPSTLLREADRRYRSPDLRQLSREIEAQHKFQLGARADTQATNSIIDSDADTAELVCTIAARRLGELSLLDNPLDDEELQRLADRATGRPVCPPRQRQRAGVRSRRVPRHVVARRRMAASGGAARRRHRRQPMTTDLPTLCTPGCPELPAVTTALENSTAQHAVRGAALQHLADPTQPAAALAHAADATLDDVRDAYTLLRGDHAVTALTTSMFYPHRLKHRLAVRTVAEWVADPSRFDRLLAGQPVLAKTVEIHPSIGTCNYRCAMCLWSDKTTLTYATQGLQARGLLSTQQWLDTITDLAARGVHTLVISGGGEALLNPDLPGILRRARELRLQTQLYTTGYNLKRSGPDLWQEVARMHRVRLSIHSPAAATYAQVTGLPLKLQALRHVSEHARRLLELRDQLASPLRLGIGFVLMAVNHHQITEIAKFAAELGVDFLDIRKDEVDVTTSLSATQLTAVQTQLNDVRDRARRGEYGALQIDLSDELVSLANDIPVVRRRTRECLAKYVRPTISPFGIVAPCDLKAEPRFAASKFNLALMPAPIDDMISDLKRTFVPDACAQCMPSSRTANAVYAKLLGDAHQGLNLCDQPFHDPTDHHG